MFIDLEQLILDYGDLKISKRQLMSQLTAADYIKLAGKIKKAAEFRSAKITARNLEVIYINGKSGSGKTVFAKYLAEQLHFDFFVSGSGEDFLDGYDKEECIILDDFRASSMKFMEMLKFLDNNTNSSVRSRYYNKDISNTKLIIITSVVPPQDLYSMFKNDTEFKEPAKQFYRRIGDVYFRIEDDGDIAGIDIESQDYNGESLGNIKDIFAKLGIDPTKKRAGSLISVFVKKTDNKGDKDPFWGGDDLRW